MRQLALAISIYVLTVPVSAQGPRYRIDLGCQPTGQALTYLCTVSIADASGKPIDGAAPILSADMPSMPMAHSVKPVTVQAVAGRPGVYQGRVSLEMLGEWAVKVQVKAPRPDIVVRKLDFQTDKVTPVTPR